MTLSLAAVASGSVAHGCPPSSHGAGPGQILSVRGMSCRAAVLVYVDARGWQHVSLRQNGSFRLGTFRCITYADQTPPGPSDSNVLIHCADHTRSFRMRYAV